MAHYAFLDENNIVTEVITGIDETELIDGKDPETWYGNFRGQVCKRASYHGRIRKQYPSKGFRYDETADVFIEPQPFPSWSLDENFDWQPPKPRPEGFFWYWDEQKQTWMNNEPESQG